MTIQIRNGTPIGNEPLCQTCSYGHIQRGFRESEEITHCYYNGAARLLPFRVRECSDYQDRRIPELYQLEKIATDLNMGPVVSIRTAGFALPNGHEADCED